MPKINEIVDKLEQIIEWVGKEYAPNEVFTEDQLYQFAVEKGWVKEDE